MVVRGFSPFVAYNLCNLLPQRPSYQSQGWTISAHPEGKRYAHSKSQAGITIVTEARIVEPGVSDQLNAWLAIICNMITEENVHLLETSHLFLDPHQESGTCNYYFADHVLRTIFWLHTLDTISIGLPHSCSSGHLRMFIKYQFALPSELKFASRIFSGGKLLDSCRAVPRNRFRIFCSCLERASGHFFACPRR